MATPNVKFRQRFGPQIVTTAELWSNWPMKAAGLLVALGVVMWSLPAAAGENNSPIWTSPDQMPQTLQNIYDFGELGAPDLEADLNAGYQRQLDLAALASASSPLDDGFAFASYDSDDDEPSQK
jgi:hypothetical protein